MSYGLYNQPVNYSGGYSANPVYSNAGGGGYGGGGGGSAFDNAVNSRGGMADVTPAQGTPGVGADSGGGGMGAGGWMALFQMIGDKLEGRRSAQATSAAAENDIPEDPKWMRPFLDEMAVEGKQLKDSELGARPKMEANAAGHSAAVSRGLSGPLAADVQADAVGRAQGQYNQWRQSALMSHRQMYMERVRQYMQAIQQWKAAQKRAGYAQREATLSRIPVGPIGKSLYGLALDNTGVDGQMPWGTGPGDTREGIDQRSAYDFKPVGTY